MTPWCDDLVCSGRRLLADRHSLPFPWTLFLHRRWCPSASHPVTLLGRGRVCVCVCVCVCVRRGV